MDSNKVADVLYTELAKLHSRAYQNAPPANPTFPYVVFNSESVSDTYPSDDYYVYIDVFDAPKGSIRAMEAIADSIQSLGRTVINNNDLTMQIERISRQFVSADDLTTSKMITMQFSCRVYFK